MASTTAGQRTPDVSYAGSSLASSTTYYWRIALVDQGGLASPWSTTTASFSLAAGGGNSAPTAPTSLLTEGQTNPSGLTDPSPEFSALFNDPNAGDVANKYRLQVSASSTSWSTLLWDSGTTTMASTTAGSRSPDISYAGAALASSTTYYWRVAFVDQGNLASPWSTAASFALAAGGTGSSTTYVVYDDALTTGWQDWSWSATRNFASTEQVFAGSYATKVVYTAAWGGFYLARETALPVTDYDTLRVALFAPTSGAAIDVELYDDQDEVVGVVPITDYIQGGTIAPNTWYDVSIPIEDLNPSKVAVGGIDFQSSAARTVFYDQIGFAGLQGSSTNGAPTAPTSPLTEGQTNPTGLTDPTPEFSALYNDPDAGDTANKYRLQVSASSTNWTTLVWDSATTSMASTTAGNRSPDISYAGSALASLTTCRVALVDQGGLASPWSTSASFSLAAGTSTPPLVADILQDLTYTYDAVGNITVIVDASQTKTAATTSYSYDALNRLTAALTSNATSSPYTQTYAYDAIGNLTNKSDLGSYTYAGDQGSSFANPHALTQVASSTYTYDQSGNLTQDGLRTNTWDYQNRLTQTVKDGTTHRYSYDHTGSRTSYFDGNATTTYASRYFDTASDGTITKHLYAGDTLVATIETTGGTPTTNTIHTDHLGGTAVVSNIDGEVIELTDYHPFGSLRTDERYGTFDESRKFTGHQYDDETGLYYMQARHQNPTIGRFVSQDLNFIELTRSIRRGTTYIEC